MDQPCLATGALSIRTASGIEGPRPLHSVFPIGHRALRHVAHRENDPDPKQRPSRRKRHPRDAVRREARRRILYRHGRRSTKSGQAGGGYGVVHGLPVSRTTDRRSAQNCSHLLFALRLIVQNDALRRGVDFHCAVGCSPSRDLRADDETATRGLSLPPTALFRSRRPLGAHSDEVGRRFRAKAAACTD